VVAVTSALAFLPLLAACGGSPDAADGGRTQRQVLAASPLQPAFDELATAFEEDHLEVDVVLTYGGSVDLAARLGEDPTSADVLATADEDSMNAASDQVKGPVSFATARLVLAVAKPAWDKVRRVRDLQTTGVRFAVCADTAPCGRIGRALLAGAGVRREPDGAEGDATDVLDEVMQGTYAAGVVYAGQVRRLRDRLHVLPLRGRAQRLNELFIAPVSLSGHPGLAQEWTDLVLGQEGRSALRAAGFMPPQG
jgi:molybdate transport system substrate-binding protein